MANKNKKKKRYSHSFKDFIGKLDVSLYLVTGGLVQNTTAIISNVTMLNMSHSYIGYNIYRILKFTNKIFKRTIISVCDDNCTTSKGQLAQIDCAHFEFNLYKLEISLTATIGAKIARFGFE